MANSNLAKAKSAKNDEFYTQYQDIEKEIMAYLEFNPNTFEGKTVLLPCDDPEWSNFTKFFAQNFERLKLKKLISTSYAPDSKSLKINYQPTLFETTNPQFDEKKTIVNGKIFTLDHDTSGDGKIDVNDLEWTYLKGDGDFKSEEIKKLRDEADIIITNPPFSLFREFLAWIIEADKQYCIIGNMNAITYKETFPLIRENKMWLGQSIHSGDREFGVPDEYPLEAAGWRIDEEIFGKNGVKKHYTKYIRVKGVRWFTNLDHGKRHQPMTLMPYDDNLKFSKHKEIKENGYQEYDNYNAIEVSFTDAIPSDYDGVMGVPISFLDKYSPEQFEIVGSDTDVKDGKLPELIKPNWNGKIDRGYVNGKRIYSRILIRHKK